MDETDDQFELDENALDALNEDTAPPLDESPWKEWLKSHWLLIAGGTLSLVFGGLGLSYLMQDPKPVPKELLTESLKHLDKNRNAQAYSLAEKLKTMDYRDPDFAGAPEYILGMVAFRRAKTESGEKADEKYFAAAHYLRKAEYHALDAARRGEWSFALGTSLYHLGAFAEARPLLEEAIEKYEAGRIETTFLLTDVYLVNGSPQALKKSLKLHQSMLESGELSPTRRDEAYLQQARCYLALGRPEEARKSLSRISEARSEQGGTIVFRSRALMADGQYDEAMKKLKSVAESYSEKADYPRRASYLMGVCAEKLEDIDAAINYYERTAHRYERSEEALVANIRAAKLLRLQGRDEEALKAYRRALQKVPSPQEYRNRWLSLEELRKEIMQAWNAWIEENSYSQAIAISKNLVSLLSEVESYELNARAHQQWAEYFETELANSTYDERIKQEGKLYERWKQSGKAYDQLAEHLKKSSDYAEALWTSAEHYRRGRDFENALKQITRFINSRPDQLLPLAIVRRGKILMSLDRLDEAVKHFRKVIENYPTAPASFQAQYIIGECYLEQNKPQRAEKAWRNVLISQELTPAAKEWRLSLLALSRLLYHTAEWKKVQTQKLEKETDPDQSKDLLDEAYGKWDEAIRRLELFLRRYPEAEEASEARYLLAKSLQQRAQLPQNQLKTAETRNVRKELQKETDRLLKQAIVEFRKLKQELLPIAEAKQLDKFGQRVLRNCYFEIAHCRYDQKKYEEAIVDYSAASNRYSRSPQVLLAYLQMANCYERLGNPIEARSMLEQARVIIRQMPDETFEDSYSNMNRQEWKQWLDWARQIHQASHSKEAA